ncbi:MAG TPA: hypothetical protein PLS43_04360 [Syntrophales bacterium]|jgi:hypothetical protein|nr:hypothetical protein [Syntrophales bacterium]
MKRSKKKSFWGAVAAGLLILCLSAPAAAAPRTVEVYNPAGQQPDGVYVDTILKKIMDETGVKRPLLAGKFTGVKKERIGIRHDEFSEVSEWFYLRGWTDGLPIVPPTERRVKEMLKGTDLPADFLVANLDPMGGQATVEKIAVNAVMAGCRPEYMPVLIAAVELAARPEFDLKGLATTTNPDAPLLILSGPIVEQLDVNAGTNTLGRGWQANASISRAIHLIIQNIGGSWPGVTDMSTIGQPGDFVMMLAENSAANPWGPLHMELGHPRAANVLAVMAAEGTHSILGIGQSDEGFLKLVAAHLAGLERPYRETMLLIIAQDTAKMLADKGWTRERMIAYITDRAKIPFRLYKERYLDSSALRKGMPDWVFRVQDPDAMIPSPLIGKLLILVAGGTGEKSTLIPGWYDAGIMSKEIRLPANWDELLPKKNP